MKISYPAAVRSVEPRWRSASATRTSRTASTASVASARCAGWGESSQANASPAGSAYQRRVRAERVRQVVVRVQARPGAPMLLELDEHGLLQHPSEAREVGMERRGHHRLAVSERERGELPKDDVVRDAERGDGADRADPRDDRAAALPEPGQHVVHRTRERHLRRIDRVGPTALARRIVHPHVVDVGDQDRESRDELPAVDGPRGEETAVDDVGELERAGGDVTGVDDPVIAEERRMRVGRAERSSRRRRTPPAVDFSSTACQNRSSRIALTSSGR